MKARLRLRPTLLAVFVAAATLVFGACDSTGTNDNGVVSDSMQILNVTPDVGADLQSTDTSFTFTFTDPVAKNEFTRTDVEQTDGERHLVDVITLYPPQAKNAKNLAPNGSLPLTLEFNQDRTELTIRPEQSLRDGFIYELYIGNADDFDTVKNEGTGFYDSRFKSKDGARFGINKNYPLERFEFSVGQNPSAPATPSISFDSDAHNVSADTIEDGTYDYTDYSATVPLEVSSVDNSGAEVKGYEVYYRSQNQAGRSGSGDQFVKVTDVEPGASSNEFEDHEGIIPASAADANGELDFTAEVENYPFAGNGGYGPIEWKVRAVSINNVRGDFSSVQTTGDNSAPRVFAIGEETFTDQSKIESFGVFFDEALDVSTVSSDAFTVIDDNGDPVSVSGVSLENVSPDANGNTVVTVTLATPRYHHELDWVEVNDTATNSPVTDLAGNAVPRFGDSQTF